MRENSPRLNPKAILLLLALCGAQLFAACSSPSESAPPVAATSGNSKPSAELLEQADKSYAEREDLARVREGLETLRRARAVDYNNFDVAWRTARLNYTLGDKTTDAAEREKAFREGIEAGETAVKVEPERAEGHFWLGANQGGYAQARGPLYGLSAAEGLRKEMETVLKLDEGFQGGSAFMVLGRLDLELPSMLGGDTKRAVETLERGMKYGEQNALYRLRLAEAYIRNKRMNDAREQINLILSMQPHPLFVPEHKEAVTKARELLDKRF
ncbi:MAG TPA: TRAP transporter TatT component family protein [Pyrinomonadaceae bacterium]|nr:TRAP transporter TatT component family protein [Pyrinomonadaceae bacterium]